MDQKRIEFINQLKDRTKHIALRIIKLQSKMPENQASWVIGKQILRSATSIAANYRSASRARSVNEFYSKLSIVIEETDETMFWLELIKDAEIFPEEKIKDLYDELTELLSIFMSARKNTQLNSKGKKK
jgi:four helix bundle protein